MENQERSLSRVTENGLMEYHNEEFVLVDGYRYEPSVLEQVINMFRSPQECRCLEAFIKPIKAEKPC